MFIHRSYFHRSYPDISLRHRDFDAGFLKRLRHSNRDSTFDIDLAADAEPETKL